MDRGSKLSAAERSRIRQLVLKRSRYFPEGNQDVDWIRLVFLGYPAMRAYALAYLASLQTCEPLQSDRLRDNRL